MILTFFNLPTNPSVINFSIDYGEKYVLVYSFNDFH